MEHNLTKLKENLENTKEALAKMTESIDNALDFLEQLKGSIKEHCEEKCENCDKNDCNDKLGILKEIIEMSDLADAGMKRWRTLETKEDLVNAIKKEVL